MNDELAFELLEHGTIILEKAHSKNGRVNLAAARAVGNASLLLGFEKLAKRCGRRCTVTGHATLNPSPIPELADHARR